MVSTFATLFFFDICYRVSEMGDDVLTVVIDIFLTFVIGFSEMGDGVLTVVIDIFPKWVMGFPKWVMRF